MIREDKEMPNAPLETWANEYFKENSKYKKQVSSFVEYLKAPNVNRIEQLASISGDDVEEFVGYSKQIKFIDTMASYLEGIKSFDDFLFSKKYRNQYIIPRGDAYGEWKSKIALKFGLKERVEREYLSNPDIKNILDTIDDYFWHTKYDELSSESRDRFIYWLCLRVYIKICLLAPAKKSVLFSLAFNDFSTNFRTVSVNGIKIKIPNGLRTNILQSLEIIKGITRKHWRDNDYFFEYFTFAVKGKKENIQTTLNAKFCKFLKDYKLLDIEDAKTSFPLEVLSNSTIYNMIEHGTNPYYISQITGTSIGRLESKFYSKLKDITYEVNAEREINISIARCDYYQYI